VKKRGSLHGVRANAWCLFIHAEAAPCLYLSHIVGPPFLVEWRHMTWRAISGGPYTAGSKVNQRHSVLVKEENGDVWRVKVPCTDIAHEYPEAGWCSLTPG